MCKVRSYVRYCVARVSWWLARRLGVTDRAEKVIANDPEFVRNVLITKLRKVSDLDLDRMIAECEVGNFKDEYIARIYHTLQELGVDTLQELKNEKYLREHRKKHG